MTTRQQLSIENVNSGTCYNMELKRTLQGFLTEEYFISYYDYVDFRNWLGMNGGLL